MRAPIPITASSYPVPTSPVIRDDLQLVDVAPTAWDALAPGQPLLSHAFLRALDQSGCATRATGWQPRVVTAWEGRELVGALPLYAKAHSYGEYVFDWGWADAYRRYGRRYYPKLVAAIPFTPVPGPRLLAATAGVRRALLDRALAMMAHDACSSLHLLFLPDDEALLCTSAGMIARTGIQFHWLNPGYRNFDDFLASFTHDKRKKIRQERRRLAACGATFIRKTGAQITAADWSFFFDCYQATYRVHHSTPYLTLPFFEQVGASLGEHLLMVQGFCDGRPVCAALDVYTAETLWGRYWGTIEYLPGLHFEACYYQAIEFCIERAITRFEGGAQGVHKLARGLLPVTTHSVHAIGDASFAPAIAQYCARERIEVSHSLDELASSSPYRSVPATD